MLLSLFQTSRGVSRIPENNLKSFNLKNYPTAEGQRGRKASVSRLSQKYPDKTQHTSIRQGIKPELIMIDKVFCCICHWYNHESNFRISLMVISLVVSASRTIDHVPVWQAKHNPGAANSLRSAGLISGTIILTALPGYRVKSISDVNMTQCN